jgi:hypothetical protein
MATKVIRVEDDCIDIIKRYSGGGSITDGIRKMERRIIDHEMKTDERSDPKSNWIPGANLTDGMTPEYWKRLKKEVDACIESAKRY